MVTTKAQKEYKILRTPLQSLHVTWTPVLVCLSETYLYTTAEIVYLLVADAPLGQAARRRRHASNKT